MTMIKLCITVIAIATTGFVISYAVFDPIWIQNDCHLAKTRCTSYVDMTMAITMTTAGMMTLFGILSMPGAQNSDGSFTEQRIRLSITMSILVIYFIWWSFALQWSSAKDPLSPMFETLTDLIKVIIPFYFGASAFSQWSERQKTNPTKKTQ